MGKELRSEFAANNALEHGIKSQTNNSLDLVETFNLYYDNLKEAQDKFKDKQTSPGFEIKSKGLFGKKKLYLNNYHKLNFLKLVSNLKDKIKIIKNRELSAQLENFYDEFERLLINIEDLLRTNKDVNEIFETMKALKGFVNNNNFTSFLK